ncbi:MAG: alpha-amylase family glycosyl hydrolase [Bacteroidota bacterium]
MKNKLTIAFSLLFTLIGQIALPQVVITSPAFPSENELVEVTFNAAEGNGGLEGYDGEVYAHTGVITNLSTGPTDWKYVKTNWGQNSEETRLERIGTDLYKLIITPDVRQYYAVPASEEILKMAFVFRSGVQVGGLWLEGKTESNGDIFVDVYPAGLFTRINLPAEDALLVSPAQQINIEASSNTADSMFLYIDNVLDKSVAGIALNEVITAEESGKHWIKIRAKNESEEALDSIYYYVLSPVTEMELPDNINDGINYLSDTEVTLCLYAPEKNNVFIMGDFNNWEFGDSGFMYRTPDGKRYWKTLQNLEAGREYIFQYLVDGSIRIGDPYAEKVSDPWNDKYISGSTYPGIMAYPTGKAQGVATVLQTARVPYTWEINDFTPPQKTDLVIYELLVRDFIARHDYTTLIDTLQYLKRLGINAIELMPVNEFEGNLSWGYNPNYYFAPDKYYGPENDFKKFIDECHKNGIAVIIDMVLNHSFGTSPMVMLYWDTDNSRPAANNPWFNPVAKHDYNVGFDFNHESPETRKLVSRVVKFWIEKYKIDGYRFDLSKGFTQKNTLGNVGAWGQYDASRIAIWKSISDTIWALKPDAYVILEHLSENTEEKELANYGMLLWASGTHDQYKEAAMGWSTNSNFASASYKNRGWNSPHLVAYMESHDEERMVYKNLTYGNNSNPSYKVRDTANAIARAGLAACFFYTIPGPKMIWQFGELGYDYTIEFNGRTGEKPIRWDYANDYRRKTLNKVISSLTRLKQDYDVFRTTDFSMNVSGYMKKIILNHAEMSVVVLGNFDVNQGNIVPGFPKTGKWYEFFTGDSITVLSANDPLILKAGEYRLYSDKKLATPETGLGTNDQPFETNHILGSVYPNPSNTLFTIPVNLHAQSFTGLYIYDATGRFVSTLFDGQLQAGQHEFTWMCEHKKPGVYLLKLVTDFNSETTRLIIR